MRSLVLNLMILVASTAIGASDVEKQTLWTSGVDGYHTYRIPSLLVTSKGSVLAFCEGRKTSKGDHGDVDLIMKRSTDGGRTWSMHRIVHEEGGEAPITIGNPCPVVDARTGTIWLTFTCDNKSVLIMSSSDDGLTWSSPRDMSATAMKPDWDWVATGPGIGIQLKHGPHKGRLLIPSDHKRELRASSPECNSHMMFSDDGGQTWQVSAPIQAGGNECQVIERGDGSLLLNTRMQSHFEGYRGIASSADGGATWSTISQEKQLPCPKCQGSLLQVGQERLLFSNPNSGVPSDNNSKGKRLNLTVRLSNDDGKTWPVSKLLHEGPSAYSSLAQLPDGAILCLFETGKSHASETLTLARFHFEWLKPASAPSERTVDAAKMRKPNIIFILADDLGWGDLHSYGHPYAKTPNLDRLANEGTRFTQFYATGVTCCPARTGLMTGKFPATFQKYPASFGFGRRVTITELLKKHGYTAGHFGKWHMGPNTEAGTYGIDVINELDEERGGRKRDSDRSRDASIYDAAIEFIENYKDRPFYLNVWSHITHHPINPAQKFVDVFKDIQIDEANFSSYQREKFATVKRNGGDVNDAMRRFLGDLYSMDQDIGRLISKLDELGLSENTLVVFNADQGAAAPKDLDAASDAPSKKNRKEKPASDERQQFALNLLGYAGPEFRGGKHTDYEGGVRVPFIARWPGHVPSGRIDDQSVLSGADWLPSLGAIAGIKIDLGNFDGEDASKALLGGIHVRTKPLFWKTNADNSDPAMRWENWKLHGTHRRRGEVELYDLSKDPGERTNLAVQLPKLVEALTVKLDAWTASLPSEYEHGETKED